MLHIDTIPLGESPRFVNHFLFHVYSIIYSRCIAYQESTQTFLVGSYRIDKPSPDDPKKIIPTRQRFVYSFTKYTVIFCVVSVSTMSSSVTLSPVPPRLLIEELKQDEIEIHSLLLMEQSTFEGII